MDTTLNQEKQIEQLEIIELKKEKDLEKINPDGMPPVQTESKEYGERIADLRESMQKVTDDFQLEYMKKDLKVTSNLGKFRDWTGQVALGRSVYKKSFGLETFALGTETKEVVEKNRSGSAIDLMDSLLGMRDVILDEKQVNDPAKTVEKLFEMAQASSNYSLTHDKKYYWTTSGEARALVSKKVQALTSKYLDQLLSKEEKETIAYNKDAAFVLGEDDKTVEKDLKQAAEHYLKFRLKMAEGCLGYMPGGETLKKKLQVLRVNERLIKLYRDKHPLEEERDKNIQAMIHDYEECLGWEMLRTITKQKTEGYDELIETHLERETDIETNEKDKLVPMDQKEELRPEQLKGIEEIDNWLIRNYDKGGNDDLQMVDKILSMSKRERLHTYYLVEKARRKTANLSDVGNSQSYIPSLKEFKNKILASKGKFWKRIFGGYVYTHKLSDALQVTTQYRKEIKNVAENEHDQKKLIKKERINGRESISPGDEERISDLMKLKSALEVFQADVKEVNEVTDKKAKKGAEIKLKESRRALASLAKLIQEKEKVYIDQDKGAVENLSENRESLSMIGYLPSLINENFLNGALPAVTEGVFGMVGAITTTVLLIQNRSQYSHEEMGEKSLEVLRSLSSFGSGAIQLASQFVSVAPLTATAQILQVGAPLASAVLSGGVAICQGVAAGKMKYHGKKAVDYLNKKREKMDLKNLNKQQWMELNYEQQMVKLQQSLRKRQEEKAATNGVGAGLFILGSVVPVFLIPAIVTTIVGGVRASRRATNIQNALFDDYFNMDKLAEKAYELRYKGKESNVLHNEKENKENIAERKQKIKEALRLRIAARAGFNSVKKATEFIASRFARQIRRILFDDKKDNESDEKKGYVALVKSLNLRINNAKKQPTEQILVRRLLAR